MSKEIRSPGELMEMVNAFRISRMILSAFELGIFSVINDTEMTSGAIAENLKTNARATDRILNALVSIGLLNKNNEKYSNTVFTSRFLVKGRPDYLAGLSHQVHLWKTWSTLTEAVKAGTSVAVEEPINERGDEWLNAFIAAMHSRAVPQSIEVADAIDFSQTTSILDIGGGSGAFSFEFLRRCNGARAVIFDLPAVVPITEKYIAGSGLKASVSTHAGDYLTDDLGSGFDLVFVSAVIHINSPEENAMLIRKCFRSMRPGGQLIILDHIMSEDRTEPAVGAVFALNMLVGTKHGDTYTENEVRSWMQDAGFRDIRRSETIQGTNLMFGIR